MPNSLNMNDKGVNILVFTTAFSRVALGLGFLFAVADRFGLWGSVEKPLVDWGNMAAFIAATDQLAPWVPDALIPTLAWLITLLEITLGFLLLLNILPRFASLLSTLLLLLFGFSMLFFLGVKAPFNYSVFSAAACGALLFALQISKRTDSP